MIGFDINRQRLEELQLGIDRTKETSVDELAAAHHLVFTSDPALLASADVFVVTVPTPIDSAKRPDLMPLEMASTTVGQALKARAAQGASTTPLVIYESTVYPGATEEVCVPILERESGLRFNAAESGAGFCCGYSPERINPGDRQHRLTTITKVTSGSTPEVGKWVDAFYGSIITAGTHLASSLKVAEAAKVIENTQRDLNIALVNELAIIFRQMNIDTLDVLEAAGTSGTFFRFAPVWWAAIALVWTPTTSPTGRAAGLPLPGGVGRPAHQRWHGPMGGGASGAGDGEEGDGDCWRPGAGAGVELQGELPGSAQHPRGGCDPRCGAMAWSHR